MQNTISKKEKLKLKNHIYSNLQKGFKWKAENIDYITNDESIYICGMLEAQNQIYQIIDEY